MFMGAWIKILIRKIHNANKEEVSSEARGLDYWNLNKRINGLTKECPQRQIPLCLVSTPKGRAIFHFLDTRKFLVMLQ
jgi:hypothetical protein